MSYSEENDCKYINEEIENCCGEKPLITKKKEDDFGWIVECRVCGDKIEFDQAYDLVKDWRRRGRCISNICPHKNNKKMR